MRHSELLDSDLADVAERVVQAAVCYLGNDLLALSPAAHVEIERRLSFCPSSTARPRTGIIDLSIQDHTNQTIVDWKLVQHAEWRDVDRERQEWDPAWAFYSYYLAGAAARGTGNFVYRNIFLRPAKKQKGIVEVSLKFTEATEVWLKRELQYTEMLLDLYEVSPQIPWPQHAPSACMAYGTRCEYWEDCKRGVVPLVEIKQTISPSRMKELKLCPERARRNSVRREDDGESEGFGGDKPELGKAFHRGIAEVYRQGWEVVRAAH